MGTVVFVGKVRRTWIDMEKRITAGNAAGLYRVYFPGICQIANRELCQASNIARRVSRVSRDAGIEVCVSRDRRRRVGMRFFCLAVWRWWRRGDRVRAA